MLTTFCDYLEYKWQRQATSSELCEAANIIVWNFWQMDGLIDCIPFGKPYVDHIQFSLFEEPEQKEQNDTDCMIYNWRDKTVIQFATLKEKVIT